MSEYLTSEERAEILELAEGYPNKKAIAVEALKVVQRSRRWISDEALRAVAQVLDMTPEELSSVATFYNLIFQKPVGRHVILLCDSISCWVKGCTGLSKCFKERLGLDFGGTTPDGRFTLIPICCIGECDGAPALMIDDDTITNARPDSIAEVLKRYE